MAAMLVGAKADRKFDSYHMKIKVTIWYLKFRKLKLVPVVSSANVLHRKNNFSGCAESHYDMFCQGPIQTLFV